MLGAALPSLCPCHPCVSNLAPLRDPLAFPRHRAASCQPNNFLKMFSILCESTNREAPTVGMRFYLNSDVAVKGVNRQLLRTSGCIVVTIILKVFKSTLEWWFQQVVFILIEFIQFGEHYAYWHNYFVFLTPFVNDLVFLDGLFLPFTAGVQRGFHKIIPRVLFLVSFNNKPLW